MPTTDDELTVLLARAVVEPATTTEVLDVVHTKHRRRVVRRRARVATAVLGVTLAVVGALSWVTSGDEREPVAVAPRPNGELVARVVDGMPATITASTGEPVTLRPVTIDPDRGFVRGPVLASGEFVAVATYDRTDAGFTFPPSRVDRVDPTGRVLDEVDLQGEVRSLADGEGARWVLTRDALVLGPEDPEFRVKRIGPGGGVTSAAVPPGEQPVGELVAGGGGVWVPVADGVLRFDPASGDYAGKLTLPTADRREVATLGKGVYVTTDGGLARIDPFGMTALAATSPGSDSVVDATLGLRGTWALVTGDDGPALVAIIGTDLDESFRVQLPHGLDARQLGRSGDRLYVTGTSAGRPVVVTLREAQGGRGAVVEETALIEADADDAAITVVGRDTLAVAADGRLWTRSLTGHD